VFSSLRGGDVLDDRQWPACRSKLCDGALRVTVDSVPTGLFRTTGS